MSDDGRNCTKCGEWKPFSMFSPMGRRAHEYPGGVDPRCKACKAAANRARYHDPATGYKDYLCSLAHEKYHTDPEFRARVLAYSRDYHKKKITQRTPAEGA